MEQAERLALARQLVDALERGALDTAEHCLHALSEQRGSHLLRQVAEVTRDVHQAFGGVVSDQRLYEISKHAMPDARERLSYVIEKSEDSAHRTLTAVETMLPIAERLSTAEAADVRAAGVSLKAGLTDVLMAQEYQDLTGQVIKKTIDIVEQVELKLVSLIIAERLATGHAVTGTKPARGEATGPAIKPAADVMNHQHDVDDLLAELGV
ncbi:MAG: protein phosphatase CheZ [Gammaproteobacteria bacterium]|nr:protein phosphatase CheZ [Gammaproteobacteria bacterium]